MIPYFNENNILNFIIIVESWLGTPYHHMWHSKGRGADCSLFVAECFKEQGLIKEVMVKEYYSTDWQINGEHLLEKTIESVKFIQGVSIAKVDKESNLLVGDILIFTFVSTGIPHHSALYIGNNTIVQAGNGGVVKTEYDNRWKRHLVSIYRIVK